MDLGGKGFAILTVTSSSMCRSAGPRCKFNLPPVHDSSHSRDVHSKAVCVYGIAIAILLIRLHRNDVGTEQWELLTGGRSNRSTAAVFGAFSRHSTLQGKSASGKTE